MSVRINLSNKIFFVDFKYRYSRRLENGEKIPRKAKKYILGKKISKKQLKKELKEYIAYESATFCPYCGCDHTVYIDHHVGYPEVWIDYYCARCGKKVAYEDNCPYTHILDEGEF